jgi:hypothetical protein
MYTLYISMPGKIKSLQGRYRAMFPGWINIC